MKKITEWLKSLFTKKKVNEPSKTVSAIPDPKAKPPKGRVP